MNTNVVNHRITTDTFIRFFLIVIILAFLWTIRDFLIALLVSVVLASAISPLAVKLKRFYIPKPITVFTVLAGIIALFIAIFILLVPTVYSEFAAFSKSFYVFQRDFINYISLYTGNKQLVSEVVREWTLKDIQSSATSIFTFGSGAISTTVGSVTYFIIQTIFIFVITFYLAVLDKGVERFLRIITPKKHEDYVIDLWERSQKKITAWASGQFILALFVGVIVYVGLRLIGLEHALLFALLAMVGEVIPIVGMMIATIPAVLVALLSGGVSLGVTVAIFYFFVTQFENHILAPVVVNRIVGIPSVIVVISLVVGAILAGFWGVLLAVPVAAVFMELVGDIENSKRAHIESISE